MYILSRFEEVKIVVNVDKLGDSHIIAAAHPHYSFSVLLTPPVFPVVAK